MFIPISDITIGQFRFSGVHEVTIKRSIHSIAETATIKIPAKARILRNGTSEAQTVITSKQFVDGDPVTINLGYNGELRTEFKGFVKGRNFDTPLQIECEGYSWLLRRNSKSLFFKSVTVKQLLQEAVSSADPKNEIKVICTADFTLSNISIDNASGFDIIEKISKYTDNAITCCFIEPDVLWCGLVYSAYAKGNDPFHQGTVSYRPGYNIFHENTLRLRDANHDPTKVVYSRKQSNGHILSASSNVLSTTKRTYSKVLNQIKDANALTMLANEQAYQLNYAGFEGNLHTFLQPYVAPGYMAYIANTNYSEQDGNYLIESTETTFNTKGARRIVEIGPKLISAK